MTLHFSDGTADLVLAYSAPDWFGRDGAGLAGLDRIDATSGNPDNNPNDPRLYETSLDLTQFGVQNNPISSISFDFGGGTTGGGNTEIMAVSGAPTPEPGVRRGRDGLAWPARRAATPGLTLSPVRFSRMSAPRSRGSRGAGVLLFYSSECDISRWSPCSNRPIASESPWITKPKTTRCATSTASRSSGSSTRT